MGSCAACRLGLASGEFIEPDGLFCVPSGGKHAVFAFTANVDNVVVAKGTTPARRVSISQVVSLSFGVSLGGGGNSSKPPAVSYVEPIGVPASIYI